MMGSILNRKTKKDSVASMSIELLPEYGWSVGNNERAFGPGTLFRGFVIVNCKELSNRASRLHLLFQGLESMLTFDIALGAMRSHKIQFFKVHSTLWRKSQQPLQPMETYKYLFTIQMPMIQYPPSMNHDFYKCTFKLSAYLYLSSEFGKTPIVAQTCIKYIPLIETKLLKVPIYLQDFKKKKLNSLLSIELLNTEYVSGETIQAIVHFKKKLNDKSISSSSSTMDDLSIVMNLYQISIFNIDDETISERLVETQTHHINGTKDQYKITLKLNESLPPSFDYGEIMCVSYKLKIKIKRSLRDNTQDIDTTKKIGLKKYLILPWSSTISIFESPIVIGTMVRGIRADDELKLYSKLSTRSTNPLPNFISTEENDHDILPRYEDARLPSYHDTSFLMTVVVP